MRRPVKPFVTEYKGTNRRAGARAGDDVFNAPPPQPAAPRGGGEAGGRGGDAYEAAMKAADALFSPATLRGRDPDTQAQPDALEGTAGGGGRILRAIDEPPPAVASPKAAATTRRRGRKPGSKNRPKAPMAEPVAAPAAIVAGTPEPVDDDFGDDEVVHAPAARSAGLRARQAKRFTWVRTKLKPGEQWKRRLPKVCW